jgi:hypothetical protein
MKVQAKEQAKILKIVHTEMVLDPLLRKLNQYTSLHDLTNLIDNLYKVLDLANLIDNLYKVLDLDNLYKVLEDFRLFFRFVFRSRASSACASESVC